MTKAREKISTDKESQEFCINFDLHLTKFKTNQILSHKISHRFLLTQPSYVLSERYRHLRKIRYTD